MPVPALSHLACNEVMYTSWQLEPFPSLESSVLSTIKLKTGTTAIGRTRDTQISDMRLSRLHCEVMVDAFNEVWVSPLYELGNVIAVNSRVCIRGDGWRQLIHGDILCLWKDEVCFRLRLAHEQPQAPHGGQCSHEEATAECLWAPPPNGSAAAAVCKAVLDAGEPGAEEATLFQLHAAGYAVEGGGCVEAASGTISGPAAISVRWAAPLVTCFGFSLFRHRKAFRFVSRELGLPITDLLNYYYAVFKPRHPLEYARFKCAMKRAAKERRQKEGQFPPWGSCLTDPVIVDDGNADHCDACKTGGELLCCETCEKAFHLACVHLHEVPDGDWFCASCIANGRSLARA